MSNDGIVLIIEDDVDVLRAARLALQPHVQRVEAATSAEGLRDTLHATPYDVVLLDMNSLEAHATALKGWTHWRSFAKSTRRCRWC